MLVTTSTHLEGYRVTQQLGVVRGIVVRSRSLLGNIALYMVAPIILIPILCYRADNWWLLFGIVFPYMFSFFATWSKNKKAKKRNEEIGLLLHQKAVWQSNDTCKSCIGKNAPCFWDLGGKMYQLDKKLMLPKELVFLIRHQVARINLCEFCVDIGRYKAMKELMNEEKINAMGEYHANSLYSNAERAALDYVTEVARDKKVDLQTFSRMKGHYSEQEICEIVFLVASEHFSNLTNIGLNIHSDMFCDLSKRKAGK